MVKSFDKQSQLKAKQEEHRSSSEYDSRNAKSQEVELTDKRSAKVAPGDTLFSILLIIETCLCHVFIGSTRTAKSTQI
ncbi:hypothetical protein EON65_45520 [archaeon]|nr:MAG: hypothetical protein EON65_45520 [archaeon]